MIRGVKVKTRGADEIELCMAASQGHSEQVETEADSRRRSETTGKRLRVGFILPYGGGMFSLRYTFGNAQ
jgi:hypothetical protein